MSQRDDPLIRRIERQAGVPGLLDLLGRRMPPTDLQSVLLETTRRRAAAVGPGRLLERYEADRFTRPATMGPRPMLELDLLALSLLPDGWEALELSPVCPLGTSSAVATVDQNKVISTVRGTEVVADATNVLALEASLRRRELLRRDPRGAGRVRLATSHRVVRAQPFEGPASYQHFRLLGLVTAGRDEGSYRFEAESLLEQLDLLVRLLVAAGVREPRVALTDLEDGRRTPALETGVLAPLRERHPGVLCEFDLERTAGRGYYASACFDVSAVDGGGHHLHLADGGFTTWTQQLLSSRKERLLIGGLGMERLCDRFFVSGR